MRMRNLSRATPFVRRAVGYAHFQSKNRGQVLALALAVLTVKMTVPNHVLGVDLLKLILRAKDPFPPRFYCHSCKQKYTLPMNSTFPVSQRLHTVWIAAYILVVLVLYDGVFSLL